MQEPSSGDKYVHHTEVFSARDVERETKRRARRPSLALVDDPLTPFEDAQRPKKRKDCAHCEECQLYRDLWETSTDSQKQEIVDGVAILACGHDVGSALLRHSRPCIWVSCKYNLQLDVRETGAYVVNFPTTPVHALPDTCALDVADRGENTLVEIAARLNVTRERARQVVESALRHLANQAEGQNLDDSQILDAGNGYVDHTEGR